MAVKKIMGRGNNVIICEPSFYTKEVKHLRYMHSLVTPGHHKTDSHTERQDTQLKCILVFQRRTLEV